MVKVWLCLSGTDLWSVGRRRRRSLLWSRDIFATLEVQRLTLTFACVEITVRRRCSLSTGATRQSRRTDCAYMYSSWGRSEGTWCRGSVPDRGWCSCWHHLMCVVVNDWCVEPGQRGWLHHTIYHTVPLPWTQYTIPYHCHERVKQRI